MICNYFLFPKTFKFIKKSIHKSVKKILNFIWIFDRFLLHFGSQNGPKNCQKSVQKSIKKINQILNWFFIDFTFIFGSNLGAPWGSNEPPFRFQDRLCTRFGAQDGARRHQGTLKLPKCSPRPPKMQTQRHPGLLKRSPRQPQIQKNK